MWLTLPGSAKPIYNFDEMKVKKDIEHKTFSKNCEKQIMMSLKEKLLLAKNLEQNDSP